MGSEMCIRDSDMCIHMLQIKPHHCLMESLEKSFPKEHYMKTLVLIISGHFQLFRNEPPDYRVLVLLSEYLKRQQYLKRNELKVDWMPIHINYLRSYQVIRELNIRPDPLDNFLALILLNQKTQ